MDGILVVDKEKGWTSHDVCAFIRSRFRLKKVGHAGTLDPLATGVLIVLLGRATKMFDHFSASDKKYEGTMQLGIETDSHDIEGKTIAEVPWQHVTAEQIQQAVQNFRGELLQEPPMVSALKHKGARLYQLARRGQVVERTKRPITVYQFDIKSIELPLIHFSTHVSKGTYVRTLAHDLGKHLSTAGVLKNLRRTCCGEFSVEEAVSIQMLKTMDLHELGKWVRQSSLSMVGK